MARRQVYNQAWLDEQQERPRRKHDQLQYQRWTTLPPIRHHNFTTRTHVFLHSPWIIKGEEEPHSEDKPLLQALGAE